MPKQEQDDSGKKKALVAAGATTAAAPLAPVWRKGAPYASGRRMIERDTKGAAGRARTSDVRSAAVGDGFRFGNEGYTARLAQKIRDKGFDESKPIKLSRYRDGNLVVTDGHHRLRAAEMLGMKRVPTKIEDVPEKKYQRRVPLVGRGAHDKSVARARKPQGKVSSKDLDSKAKSRPGPLGDAYNKFNSAAERAGMRASKFLRQRPGVGRTAVKVAAGGAVGAVTGAAAVTALNAASKDKKKEDVGKGLSSSLRPGYRALGKYGEPQGDLSDYSSFQRAVIMNHARGKNASMYEARRREKLRSADALESEGHGYGAAVQQYRAKKYQGFRDEQIKTAREQKKLNQEYLDAKKIKSAEGKTDWNAEMRRENLRALRRRKSGGVSKGLTSAMKRAKKTGDWYSLSIDDLNRMDQNAAGRAAAKRVAYARKNPDNPHFRLDAERAIRTGKKIRSQRRQKNGYGDVRQRIPPALKGGQPMQKAAWQFVSLTR